MEKVLGLIGFPLGHSFSKRYFTEKFHKEKIDNFSYQNFPLESVDGVAQMIEENPNLIGFNVTIPHKVAVMPLLSEIDENAAKIGAVNCVKIIREKGEVRLVGYNTDFVGFRDALLDALGSKRPKALILGTGGASKAVAAALDSLKIEWKYLSRTASDNTLSYEDATAELIAEHELIINTTPLGMYPKCDVKPQIEYSAITKSHLLFDLIFNPNETEFMAEGRKRGATVKNGYQMLLGQAEAWWQIINTKM